MNMFACVLAALVLVGLTNAQWTQRKQTICHYRIAGEFYSCEVCSCYGIRICDARDGLHGCRRSDRREYDDFYANLFASRLPSHPDCELPWIDQ